MLNLQIIIIFVALVAPYFIWSRYKGRKQTLYRGEATITTTSRFSLHSQSSGFDYEFLEVEAPNQPFVMAKVSKQRCESLAKDSLSVKAQVTIAKFPLGKPFVDTIVWPGETAIEDGGNGEFNGLALSGLYLMLGFGSIILTSLPALTPTALSLHVWLYASALLLAAAGFTMSALKPAPKLARKDMSATFLGIPLGRGLFSAALLFALCAAGTVACFWSFGIWILIPGIHCAMALGGLTALAIKIRQQ